MKPPFEIDIPPDNYCPYCKAALIELYDDHNKPRYYKSLLNKYQDNKLEITDVFRKITLSHFRCQSCRHKFMIDWRFGYPVPYILETKSKELT